MLHIRMPDGGNSLQILAGAAEYAGRLDKERRVLSWCSCTSEAEAGCQVAFDENSYCDDAACCA
jgi:hypothetical protein